MKSLLVLIVALGFSTVIDAQAKNENIHKIDKSKQLQVVEASCGECQFKMAGTSCDLAVRINGKAYFVDGTSIDEHGDAHSKEGFCEKIRTAEVQGEIVGGRYKATYFKLLKTN